MLEASDGRRRSVRPSFSKVSREQETEEGGGGEAETSHGALEGRAIVLRAGRDEATLEGEERVADGALRDHALVSHLEQLLPRFLVTSSVTMAVGAVLLALSRKSAAKQRIGELSIQVQFHVGSIVGGSHMSPLPGGKRRRGSGSGRPTQRASTRTRAGP